MTDLHEPNKQEKTISSLPLQANKKMPVTYIGLGILAVGIVLVNVFLLQKPEEKKSHDTGDTISMKSVDPITKQDNQSIQNNNEQITLKQKLEEAKAKDFVERLQAVQTAEVGATSQSTNQNSNAILASSNQSQNPATAMPPDANMAFMQGASNEQAQRSFATKFAPQPYLIGQGKFIFGTLAVAINSDLPGQVSAIVNQDVYGEQGRNVLIPRGSRLIGEYRSGLANNQSRLFVVWTRVIQPNGISVMIGSEGTDALGQGGLTGLVDYHFLARFGSATLISLLGAGAANVGVNPDDQYNSMAAYRQAVAQSMAQQSTNMLNQSANIPPTVHIPQGEKITVFVNKDLDFSRVYR